MNRVLVHPQVERYVRALAPEPRQRLVKAMKRLPAGDTKSLEGRLAGYWRLRVGGYRIIFADSVKDGVRIFDCLYVEQRSFVYDIFEQILAENLLE